MIRLADIWPIASPEHYKLHFARWNGENQPLEVWARDKQEWQGWQEYRPARDDFNRPFIFSLVQFYHEPDIWLFGGVFQLCCTDQILVTMALPRAYIMRGAGIQFDQVPSSG